MSMARPQCDTWETGSTVGEVSFTNNLNRWWRTCRESMMGITGYALEHALEHTHTHIREWFAHVTAVGPD